ncbi:tetraspanin-18-like isoform X1 [Ruditapes philippinarum]|uniref:tetraspanin-18-like isoform X1 n=1 Tax=Ruditapes philippinarum TaxID=129788 RepID=UPI00295ACFD8|nr:tetraspanin-18-like isoform X1 [Ruditapes philippinarum]XP_060605342.1 tetraspanin-18-like isoform X1 [Ruditapes philippinarum]XP_060605343.1 tetraspanin-18-like isoform X1 [Ruditapes philippinarum]XP_060605344.1 tetraspanin-18-like isoform X1 [Ruditapes philippinarum]XP_060605345.1 tetraspanin-18-like isoform X1 [Ruditapes philippinarum]XP_060605346.1 tetraspanin-18-like isoform X1 [Ruditapes philippinarum]
MAGLMEEKEFESKREKRKAPKPPPKPKRGRKYSRDGSLTTPLNKRHLDDYPRYPAKHVRSLSIRSQPEEPCFSCLRTAVHCYNIVILILGLGVLGVGIWLLVTEYSAREVTVLVGSNLFEIGTYLMIAGGGTIALLAFCGCCGTMREDKCVLAFYGVTLTLVLLALVSGSALAFIFRNELTGQVKDNIVNTLSKGYGIDLRKNSQNRLITDAWDSLQRSLQCCGAYGDINSSHSWSFYRQHSDWYLLTNNRSPYVPDSCCSGDKQICTGVQTINGPPSKGPPVYSSYAKNEHLYTEGCYEKVMVHLERNALILGGVAAFVPLLLIIGIVIVFCMCARVRKDEIYDEDDV